MALMPRWTLVSESHAFSMWLKRFGFTVGTFGFTVGTFGFTVGGFGFTVDTFGFTGGGTAGCCRCKSAGNVASFVETLDNSSYCFGSSPLKRVAFLRFAFVTSGMYWNSVHKARTVRGVSRPSRASEICVILLSDKEWTLFRLIYVPCPSCLGRRGSRDR